MYPQGAAVTDNRFENYPPAPTFAAQDDVAAEPVSGVVTPAKPYSIPPRTRRPSRRVMLALMIGVPVAVGLGIALNVDDDGDHEADAGSFLLADHEISVPLNWTYELSADGEVATLARAGNTVKIAAVRRFDGEQAIDVIGEQTGALVPTDYTSRRMEEPVDSSSGRFDRATLTGTAELHGAHVRILSNLWLTEGEGLIAVRLLTEASRSSYTTEAAEIVRAVGENF